jgi:hypothetical protein
MLIFAVSFCGIHRHFDVLRFILTHPHSSTVPPPPHKKYPFDFKDLLRV